MNARERAAEVLAEHCYTYPDSFCQCDAYVGRSPWKDHPAHVAAALAEAGLLADADTAALKADE